MLFVQFRKNNGSCLNDKQLISALSFHFAEITGVNEYIIEKYTSLICRLDKYEKTNKIGKKVYTIVRF